MIPSRPGRQPLGRLDGLLQGGVFIEAGGPTRLPQRFGITIQSSWRLGYMPTLRPIRAAAWTTAAAAVKSGAALSILLATSNTHSLKGSGSRSSSNSSTSGTLCPGETASPATPDRSP